MKHRVLRGMGKFTGISIKINACQIKNSTCTLPHKLNNSDLKMSSTIFFFEKKYLLKLVCFIDNYSLVYRIRLPVIAVC